MRNKIVIGAIAFLMSMVFHGVAMAIWIDSVDVVPIHPSNIDVITFNIFGGANVRPSQVEYDQFSQDGTSLQLDLYVAIGFLQATSDWNYSKEIQPLLPATYSLEVRAFSYDSGTLWDTYTTNFTVTPEPCTVAFLGIGFPLLRAFSKRKL